jgi:hypothetical protein
VEPSRCLTCTRCSKAKFENSRSSIAACTESGELGSDAGEFWSVCTELACTVDFFLGFVEWEGKKNFVLLFLEFQ